MKLPERKRRLANAFLVAFIMIISSTAVIAADEIP